MELFGWQIDRILFSIAIFMFFQFFRVFFRKIILGIASKITKKTKTTFDDDLLEAIKKPMDFIFIVVGLNFAVAVLELPKGADEFLNNLIRSGFAFSIFWALFNIIDLLSDMIHKFATKFGKVLSSDIENFIVKFLKFIVLSIGFISILQEWGYNISGFLASLGLIGMAFALAAKDTAANLFGSLVIFTDRPFKIGDWIKTPNVEGTIEEIGIRSTRVRTFAQALVTVPNAVLANSAILNWSRMGKRRIKMKIGLTYSTTRSQLERIVSDIRDMLIDHQEIHQETIHVYFTDFDDSSLGIFCYFFTNTTNWGKYMETREDVNLKIMKIVEDNGSSFAFPSRSIYLESNDGNNTIM